MQDGPFADTKEAFAGIFMLDVPDLDAALAWAESPPRSGADRTPSRSRGRTRGA